MYLCVLQVACFTSEPFKVQVQVRGLWGGNSLAATGCMSVLTSASPLDENSFEEMEKVGALPGASNARRGVGGVIS